jgi:hypothetical protein
LNQDLHQERSQGDYRSCCAQPGLIWHRVFLVYTLPNFKSKILTQISDMQKDDGPLLFSLLGQCFQDAGLTEWTSIIAKQCSNNADRMKACPNHADCTKSNFNKCIRDYLQDVTGFPNICNQLICWLCTAKKPALMSMHKFMWHHAQLLSYLKDDYRIGRGLRTTEV